MTDRRKIEDRIKKKEQEIHELESQIHEARVYIQALQDVLRMLPRDPSDPHASPVATLRSGSAVAQAREAILREKKPLHISDILERAGKQQTREARISLSGSLAAYVRQGEIFTRTAPNTFGLVELGHTAAQGEREPPAEFGSEGADAE